MRTILGMHLVIIQTLDCIFFSVVQGYHNYCHLAWGSNITAGHKSHLLQKKAVRIADHRHFLAHTEPICKRLRIVKIVDMFQISIWKFYYKLIQFNSIQFNSLLQTKVHIQVHIYIYINK